MLNALNYLRAWPHLTLGAFNWRLDSRLRRSTSPPRSCLRYLIPFTSVWLRAWGVPQTKIYH